MSTEANLLQVFRTLDKFQSAVPCHVGPALNRAALRLASRYIPSEYNVTIEHPEGLGVVYAGEKSGKVYAVAYIGTASKSAWHFRFKSMEDVRERAERFFQGLHQHQELVRGRRQQENQPHTLKVGDIITNSWGYDQTNVDWYKIIKTTRNFVWLQPIAGSITEATGMMSGQTAPAVDTSGADPSAWGFKPFGEITKHKATGERVCMKFGSGSKWDGKPMHCSWYA